MALSLWPRKAFYWLLGAFIILSLGVSPPARPADVDYFEAVGLEKIEGKVAAPSFSLPDLQGNRVSLDNLQGKGVMLYFWTTW